jgi:hypothetical protein
MQAEAPPGAAQGMPIIGNFGAAGQAPIGATRDPERSAIGAAMRA